MKSGQHGGESPALEEAWVPPERGGPQARPCGVRGPAEDFGLCEEGQGEVS